MNGGGGSSSAVTSPTTTEQNDATPSLSQDMMQGGIFGALAAFVCMGLLSLIRRRRRRKAAELMAFNEDENEEFDLHLEMNNASKGKEFRDVPIDVRSQSSHSNGGGHSRNGVTVSRSSSRGSAEII